MRMIDDKDCKDLLYVRCMGQDKAFIAAMEQVIDDCPTIDAVEVVRCKECYFVNCYDELSPRYECTRMLGSLQVKPDDFCSYGKRRKENNV